MISFRSFRGIWMLGVALIAVSVLAGSVALWSGAQAADGTATPAPSGCAKASDAKSAPAGTPAAGATCVEVDMHDIYFGANLITIPADTRVTFVIHNYGQALHTFVISDHNNKNVPNLNINVSQNPGTQSTITIEAPAGDYYFFCDVPGHEEAGMWGILKVQKDGSITAQHADDPKAS